MQAPTLCLADLEAFDPYHRRTGGRATHTCCPLCGGDKKRDQAHRSLSYNEQTGAWRCFRCAATGVLKDFWKDREQERPARDFQAGRSSFQKRRARGVSRFSLPDEKPAAASPVRIHSETNSPPAGMLIEAIKPEELREALNNRALETAADGPGAVYLASRGLDPEFCQKAKCRYAPSFMGAPAIIFPIHGKGGDLVAVQGRFINGDERRMRSKGGRKLGVFATPGALDKGTIPVFVEAPIDALSLAMAGVPAIALCGSNGVPDWLIDRCVLKAVFAAFDNDEPTERHPRGVGNHAAEALADALAPVGGYVKRLCPKSGKDWNEILKRGGVDALRRELAPFFDYVRSLTSEGETEFDQAREPDPVIPLGTMVLEPTAPASTSTAGPVDPVWDESAASAQLETDRTETAADRMPEPLPMSPEVAAFQEQVTEEEYKEVIRALRTAALENRLPVPSELITLRPGERIIDPNKFVVLAFDRIQALRNTPATTRRQQIRAQESIMRIADDLDRIAAWWFGLVGEEVYEGNKPV